MRNEELNAYLIHHRKYREKSYIIHLFSLEHGRVDGILRQAPPPQYQPIQVLATGKNELKNLSHLEIQSQPIFLTGDAFFIGFYLNELLLKLCPAEQEMPHTFYAYQRSIQALTQLKHSTQADADLRQILRQFEMRLLHDLGYFMDYSCDFQQQDIVPTQHYHYHVEQGFIACMPSRNSFLGADIQSMQQYDEQQDLNPQQVAFLTLFYRQVLNHLLADKPLKSRQLWIQHKSK